MINSFDTPFDPSMLGTSAVVISCPDRDNARDLMEILSECGVRWYTGDNPATFDCCWDEYKENTVYYIETRKSMTFDHRKRPSTEDYIKCQFYGIESGAEISDSEFEAIISAGGVDKGGKAYVAQ